MTYCGFWVLIDLHAHNQPAEHMPDGGDPSLQDHMHTHLQHLPPIPHPGYNQPGYQTAESTTTQDRDTTTRNPSAPWRTSEAAKPATPS